MIAPRLSPPEHVRLQRSTMVRIMDHANAGDDSNIFLYCQGAALYTVVLRTVECHTMVHLTDQVLDSFKHETA